MSSNSPVGKLGQGGGTNPNLLINSNKKINQRGLDRASVLDGEYHVDRWMRDPAGDKQFVEYQGPGGDVTLSWTGGGTGYINGVSGQSPITASVPEDTNIAVIVPEAGNYSKLEAGSQATPWCLAGGTVGGEDTLCCRYYWQGQAASGAGHITGRDMASNILGPEASFKARMRVSPTMAIVTDPVYTNCSHGNLVAGVDGFIHRLTSSNSSYMRAAGGEYSADAEIYP